MSTSYGSLPQNLEHPSHGLLKDTGFVWHVYHKFHAKCLKGVCSKIIDYKKKKKKKKLAEVRYHHEIGY